jgi:hypothetical protein
MKTPLSACLCFALFFTLSNAHAADAQSTTQQAEPDYENLAASICSRAHRGLNRGERLKSLVVNFMTRNNLSHNNPPTNADIIRMFNANKNKMKCRGLHFVTYLMGEDLGGVVFDEFINDAIFDENEQVFFDFNVVTGVYNPTTKKPEPMTVLDFVEKVALPERSRDGFEISRADYEGTREALIEAYGAKRFSELSEAEREY